MDHTSRRWLRLVGIRHRSPQQLRRLVDRRAYDRDIAAEKAVIEWQRQVLGARHGTRPAAS